MLDPELLYQSVPEIWDSMAGTRPVLVHLLEGYMDAGDIGSEIRDQLLDHGNPELLVRFDVDQLHDYRSRRPTVVFDTDHWVSVEEFELGLYRLVDQAGTPFLLLAGPEPDNQWNRTRRAITTLCDRLDVRLAVTAYGIPTGIPHTRPTLIHSYSNNPDLVGENTSIFGRAELPGSFGATLELALAEQGIDTLGLATHVPHYLAQANFAQAAVTAVERLQEVAGLSLDLPQLEQRARTNLADITNEVKESSEVQAVVAQLEQQYDQYQADQPGPLPSADEIGAELERFLAERNRKDEEGR